MKVGDLPQVSLQTMNSHVCVPVLELEALLRISASHLHSVLSLGLITPHSSGLDTALMNKSRLKYLSHLVLVSSSPQPCLQKSCLSLLCSDFKEPSVVILCCFHSCA